MLNGTLVGVGLKGNQRENRGPPTLTPAHILGVFLVCVCQLDRAGDYSNHLTSQEVDGSIRNWKEEPI